MPRTQRRNKKNKVIKINFHRKLYTQKAIQAAVKAYAHLAVFDSKKTEKYIQVQISDVDKKVQDVIRDEFANYVLSLM